MRILSKLLSTVAAVLLSALLPLTAIAETDDGESKYRHGQQASHSTSDIVEDDPATRGTAD